MNVESTLVWVSLLPEIGLLVLCALVLGLEVLLRERASRYLGWLTFAGVLVIALLTLFFANPGQEGLLVWGGMLRFDQAGYVFRMLFLLGAGVTALFSMDDPQIGKRGEFYMLLLVSTLGMSLMASAADLVMLYLAIETTSIPLYILSGFITRDDKSTEAGLKYMLFGAMTSAILLYAFSLIYGFTGTTQLYLMAEKFSTVPIPLAGLGLVLLMTVAGLAFKISAVPMHFWAPDVYEGAPAPVAGFLSTASKAAGFAVLMRVLAVAFPALTGIWSTLLAVLAVATMLVGNLLALPQRNIKRLLAYSSIAQAGYILIGLATGSVDGANAIMYYLMAYLVTNLAAFGVVEVASRSLGSDQLADYRGLGRRSPGLGVALLLVLLSLGGIPPFAGFFGKFLVFAAAVQNNLIWLVVIGVLNTVVGLYYYLRLLQLIYEPAEGEVKLSLPGAWKAALAICLVGVLVLGVVFVPGYEWATQAATAIWVH
ncbi:MAG: NADH-quinone oxidoreductase subunit N [Anaerolineae bacterium]|nr:NADH-quinone oxidoreductase subunit N [Anaerolineae bacterium]